MVKNDSSRVFGLFKKIMSLVLYEICIKQKFLWFINIVQKSGSQVITKNCSRSMRFQYSLVINISLIDEYLTLIFGIDRHEWKKQGSLTGFVKKFSFQEMGAISGPKMVHPHNSGSTRSFLNFAQ